MYYNEEEIDKLIQPVVDRQENINNWLIGKMASRIKEIGELLPSDIMTLDVLAKTGADVRVINSELVKETQLQEIQIKRIIKNAAQNVYSGVKPFFDYRQKPFIPFEENEQVQRIVKAIEKQTSGTYNNMAKAQAFMTRDLKNPKVLHPTPVARTYQNVVDKAIQTVKSGVDYGTAMRSVVKELVDSGLKTVEYNSEKGKITTQRMDAAVRRNLIDGVRAVNQGVQDEVGRQFGANGVEITVHACPAPDHQYVQGHQFAMSEWQKIAPPPDTIQKDGSIDTSAYEIYKVPKDADFNENDDNNWVYDVNGKRYARFSRRIGTCNCKHFAYNIIIGQAPQNYTDKQLQEILDENEKGVDIDGKHYTKYQATQVQRALERNIRYAKEEQMAMKEAGDMEGVQKAQDKVAKYLHEYEDFSNKAGLRMKYDRIRVEGYKKVRF